MSHTSSSARKQLNVHFLDQKDQVSSDSQIGGDITSLAANRDHISDISWHSVQILKRPIKFISSHWTTSDAVVFEDHTFPLDIFTRANRTVRALAETFTFFRADMKVTVQLNGTRFHCGRLMVAWIPLTQPDNLKCYLAHDIHTLSGMPHVLLDASKTDTATLDIPFFLPVHSAPLSSYGGRGLNWGKLLVCSFSPLYTAGTSSPSLDFSIWTEFVNPHISVPREQRDLNIPVNMDAQGLDSFWDDLESMVLPFSLTPPSDEAASRANAAEDLASESPEDLGGGSTEVTEEDDVALGMMTPGADALNVTPCSVGGDAIRNGLDPQRFPSDEDDTVAPSIKDDIMSGMKSMGGGKGLAKGSDQDIKKGWKATTDAVKDLFSGDFSGAFDKWGDMIGNGLGFFSKNAQLFLDAPTITGQEGSQKKYVTGNNSLGDGPVHIPRLSLFPKTGHFLDKGIDPSGVNIMDIKHITSSPMLLTTSQWANTLGPGSILYRFPVHPMVSPIILYGTSAGAQMTYLAGAAKAFTLWRGSIEYLIDFVASEFHAGRVMVSFVPGIFPAADYNDIQLSSFPLAVFDLADGHEFKFKVPYQSIYPWSQVSGLAIGTGGASFMPNWPLGAMPFLAQSPGYIVVSIVNALKMPEIATTSIETMMWVNGGDDFEVIIPRALDPRQRLNIDLTRRPVLMEAQGISDTITTRDEKTGSETVLTTVETPMSNRLHFAGEHVADIRTLCRRFSKIDELSISLQANKYNTLTVLLRAAGFLESGSAGAITQSRMDFMSYFNDFYIAWSGSMRFKVLTSVSKNYAVNAIVWHDPVSFVGNTYTPNDIDFVVIDPTVDSIGVSGFGSRIVNLASEPCIDFEIPYASQMHFLLNPNIGTDTIIPTWLYNQQDNGVFNVRFETGDPTASDVPFSISLFRAAGDDFKYHFLVPPPPVRVDVEAVSPDMLYIPYVL